MYQRTFAFFFTVVLALPAMTLSAEEFLLWPKGHAANTTGEFNAADSSGHTTTKFNPSIVTVLPEKEKRTGVAIVICPGGGYLRHAFEKEGMEVGRWMAERGICAFVVKYRCGGEPNHYPAPTNDGMRAMRWVRHHAERYGIDPKKVGVMGFSAGGHLASSITTLSDDGNSEADDPIDHQSSRPAFSMLIYPVITMQGEAAHAGSRQRLLGDKPDEVVVKKLSTELQIDEKTPPTFLVHATDDRVVQVENSLLFYKALVKAGVPAELHVYADGGHGFGMREMGKHSDHWPEVADRWLRHRGLIP